MKAKLHRVGIVVTDLDKSIALYEKLLGSKFHRTGDAVAKAVGIQVAAAWEAGVELVRPIPGSTNPAALKMFEFLKSHGDGGVFAIGYRADDVDAALRIASECGIEKLLPTFAFTQEQLDSEFNGAYTRFEETVLDTMAKMGYLFAYNTIEDAK